MEQAILLEILVRPADQSRGRHNPRAVKRKMSNFPLRRRGTPSLPAFDPAAAIRIVK